MTEQIGLNGYNYENKIDLTRVKSSGEITWYKPNGIVDKKLAIQFMSPDNLLVVNIILNVLPSKIKYSINCTYNIFIKLKSTNSYLRNKICTQLLYIYIS